MAKNNEKSEKDFRKIIGDLHVVGEKDIP